ncbi:hypothetical protein D9613_002273 [Agrocybe pediades]|uniref:Uncharacterized protein n=1 Tax=Agrocybe pediades TaxID=84607 RepID=A0A8H4R3R3_9AGAR|nr:hypothetical protein D9613_002273 [Agrocybe pediades]
MPPKKAAKKVTKPKKAATTLKQADAAQNATIIGGKRERANSVVELEGVSNKKLKVDSSNAGHETDGAPHEVASTEEPAKTRELDASVKEELDDLKLTLSDHILPSLAAVMDAIDFSKPTRPETVEETIEAIIAELEERALGGKSIASDLASIKIVDEKYSEGEYDPDPEGFEKDVRRRLDKAEDMAGRLTRQYLKDIIKELGFFGRSGTNAGLADEVVSILTHKAKNGGKLVREYRIVKEVYSCCYGCCGDESGLGEGYDSEEGEEGEEEEGY